MPKITKKTLRQFYALDIWLGHVYGHETHFDTLLNDEGFSQIEIEQIMGEHLREFSEAVIALLASYPDLPTEWRNKPMMQYYGLIDGKPQRLEAIGTSLHVSPTRIIQLLNQRMRLYRDYKRQAEFQRDIAAIGRGLLEKASENF
jgi:DNA-directed RNA polymerase sigma subunit (sigma70/sigma32)